MLFESRFGFYIKYAARVSWSCLDAFVSTKLLYAEKMHSVKINEGLFETVLLSYQYQLPFHFSCVY